MPSDKRQISDWQVEMLRLTAFCEGDQPELPLGAWWQEIVGETPEEETRKVREGISTLAGRFSSGVLFLEYRPFRIDIKLHSLVEGDSASTGFPVLGGFESTSDAFVADASKVFGLAGFPPIIRLAYGTVVYCPVADRPSGYKQLGAYLPSVRIDVENTSDFLYRINRRRASTSGIEGLHVNRLTNWSVAVKRCMVASETDLRTVDVAAACRLEMDINTTPEQKTPFPASKLQGLLKELVEAGKELVAKGDVP